MLCLQGFYSLTCSATATALRVGDRRAARALPATGFLGQLGAI
jgi:hypothetical protein